MMFNNPKYENATGLLRMADYHPCRTAEGDKNPEFGPIDRYILDVKNGKKSGIDHFFARIDPVLAAGVVLVIVPSHDPSNVNSGFRTLAQRLAANGRVDATGCLVRHKAIDKLTKGGDRSLQTHLNSTRVENRELIRGRAVLLMDDVTTTGNSLEAGKLLLLSAGATQVRCLVLGKTTR